MNEYHEKLKQQYWDAVQYGSHDDIYNATKALLRYEEEIIQNIKDSLMFKKLLADKR
jgi:hypothetical protein